MGFGRNDCRLLRNHIRLCRSMRKETHYNLQAQLGLGDSDAQLKSRRPTPKNLLDSRHLNLLKQGPAAICKEPS